MGFITKATTRPFKRSGMIKGTKPTAIAAKIDLPIVFFIFSPITKIYNILHTYNDIFSYLYQNQATVSVALATS